MLKLRERPDLGPDREDNAAQAAFEARVNAAGGWTEFVNRPGVREIGPVDHMAEARYGAEANT